jgi:hypothetical protein
MDLDSAAGQSILGFNLKLVSIGSDVLRTLDLNTLFRDMVWFFWSGRFGWFLRVGFGFHFLKKEEVDRYWIFLVFQDLDKFLGRFFGHWTD